MEPTFSDGDLVLTTTLNSKLQKGDIVILKDPFRPDQKICKRVVGKLHRVLVYKLHPASIFQ